MRRRYIGMVSLAGLLVAATSAASQWENTGLPGCKVAGVGQDPRVPQNLFVGCYDWWNRLTQSGFPTDAYRSRDGGATWQDISDPGMLGLRSFVLAPSSPAALYAVTQSGLLRSRDEGESWIHVAEGLFSDILRIEIDPSDPDTVYICAWSGGNRELYRTRNGGDSWEPLGTQITTVDVSPHDSQVLYGYYTGVLRSSDGGTTWESPSGQFSSYVSEFEFHPTDPSTVYAATSGGIYRTTNAGISWSLVRQTLEPAAIAIREVPFEIWIGSRFRGIEVSSDGGDTWTDRNVGMDSTTILDLLPDDSNPSRVLVGALSGLLESLDAGASWVHRDHGMVNAFVETLTSVSAGDSLYAAGRDGGAGLFRSRDSASTWNRLDTPVDDAAVDALAVQPSNPDLVLGGFTTPMYVCPGVCPNHSVLETTDGGETWAVSFGFSVEVAWDLAFDPLVPTTAFMATGAFWKRTESETWAANYQPPYSREIAVDPTNPFVLYVGTFFDGVWKSLDAGASFQPTPLAEPAEVFQIAIDPSAPENVWAATDVGVMRSPDAGESWEPRGAGLPLAEATLSDLQVHPDWSDNVFVSMKPNGSSSAGGVFESRDAGLTWQPLNDGLTSPHVTRLAFTRGGLYLHAATLGRGVFRHQLPFVDAEFGPYARFVDALAAAGVTAGCGRRRFCPDDAVSRAQSSVLLLRSLEGSTYAPPEATGAVFADVPADAFAAAWIEELFDRGITAGCGSGLFCPDLQVTRAQAAVLNLRTKNGDSYQPPPPTGTLFTDVPVSHFAAAWIEEFARQGYTAGCAPNLYCPDQAVSRGQMAVFLAGVFALL